MRHYPFTIEASKPFAESKIWQLNRNYYQKQGVEAWSSGVVPHHLTSNSRIGKTYADLIFSILEDLASQGDSSSIVHILELGAGHGRLSFHILKHLDELILKSGIDIPPYKYIISDIAEKNLDFFLHHPQFEGYLKSGQLDVAYFDAVKSEELHLMYSKETIKTKTLKQPIITIGNYFFDSIQNDLFHIKNGKLYRTDLGLQSAIDVSKIDESTLLDNLNLEYVDIEVGEEVYKNKILNQILMKSKRIYESTYLLFPKTGLGCIDRIKEFSVAGLILLTLDKGSHLTQDIDHQEAPVMTTHGSMSFSVNFHAFIEHCLHNNGFAIFPSLASFHLQIGCLIYTDRPQEYTQLKASYKRNIDDFGPDDFNTIKKLIYKNNNSLTLPEIFASLRLAAYDSTLFINLLPRIKFLLPQITIEERRRIRELMRRTWEMYFSINESIDLAFEMGGIYYQLGYYEDALISFDQSKTIFGQTPDNYYNSILCYYQLRQDKMFSKKLKEGQKMFPDFKGFKDLINLDLGAA